MFVVFWVVFPWIQWFLSNCRMRVACRLWILASFLFLYSFSNLNLLVYVCLFVNSQSEKGRISWLPGEVLGLILSLLTFKEALAATCVSWRWRYLLMAQWTELDFDGCGDSHHGIFRDLKSLNNARARFAEGVNNVLGHYDRSNSCRMSFTSNIPNHGKVWTICLWERHYSIGTLLRNSLKDILVN